MYSGGEVIKQINAQSGAHCELDRRGQNQDRVNRTFFIRGNPDAVENCKRIIMEKVGMVSGKFRFMYLNILHQLCPRCSS